MGTAAEIALRQSVARPLVMIGKLRTIAMQVGS